MLRVEPTKSGLLPWQEEVFIDPTRFRTCCCARRSGKTILALNEILRAAQSGMNQTVWYVAPTYKMAKRIMWRMLKQAIPPHLIESKNETDLEITLKGYGSLIALKGCEDPDTLLGDSLSFLVVDETQSVDMDVIDTVLRPAMSDQMADGLFIGTPRGKGTNTMYTTYMRGLTRPDWSSFSVDAYKAGVIPLEEIESAKETLPLPKFKQEYLASFEESQGRCFYNFSTEKTIRDDLIDTGGELLIGVDFNVNPMTAVVGVEAGDELHIIDEFYIPHANTSLLCDEIGKRYPHRRITTYPDASGNSRSTKSTSGETDFTIIKSHGFGLSAPRKNPYISDSLNDANALLMNAKGKRRLYVSNKCEHTIASLDGLMYAEGQNVPEKKSGLDHIADALRYLISRRYSIVKREAKLVTLDSIF